MGKGYNLYTKIRYAASQAVPGMQDILACDNYVDLIIASQIIWDHPVGSFEREKLHDAYLAKLYTINQEHSWGLVENFTLGDQPKSKDHDGHDSGHDYRVGDWW